LALVIGKAGGVIIAVIMGCVLFGAAIYAQVRLSLAGALTVIRRRIVIKDAWHATKGRFWTLFGVYLLIWLAFLIITIVITALTNPHLLVAYASFDAQAINAVAQEQLAQQGAGPSIGLIVQMLLGAVLFTAMLAVAFGAVATAALELGEPASDEV